MARRYIIATDLDGTLLDHHDYTFDAALGALQRCHDLSIPVILNTSKTYSEAAALAKQLSLSDPLIVENGSALFWRKPTENHQNECKVFGTERSVILAFLDQIRRHYGWKFAGFNDWSVEQISEKTGLSLIDAKRASQKRFSEPFIWQDSDEALSKLIELASEQDLKVMRGGRFYHLQGHTDKAKPLQWLMEHHKQIFAMSDSVDNQRPTLIALGDNHNDTEMLNVADIAVCVRSPIAEYPPLENRKTVIHTQGYGPEGWAEAIYSILGEGPG